ncbi:excisionase family DNA-binding protein [Tepidimonas charontis]|nr:excisionase family DNA-binding protein [Tepidimonas charontis]
MCALVGVDHIAEHLGVTRDSIYRWIDRKHLPAQRVGWLWWFKEGVPGDGKGTVGFR